MGEDLVFAGNTIRIDFTVTTGGTAGGVTVAQWAMFDKRPEEAIASQTAAVSKTLGSGITVADGSVTGTVVVSVVLQPADTNALDGDFYHELRLTAGGDVNHFSNGTIRLQPGAL